MHDYSDFTSRASAARETTSWNGLCRILGLRERRTSKHAPWRDVVRWFETADRFLGGNGEPLHKNADALARAKEIAARIILGENEEGILELAEAEAKGRSAFSTSLRRLPFDAYIDDLKPGFARWLLVQNAPKEHLPSGTFFRIALREIRLGNFPMERPSHGFRTFGFLAHRHGGESMAKGARVLWQKFSLDTGLGSNVTDAGFREILLAAGEGDDDNE
ncbi:hypothetical protein ACFFP0_31690 [Rhizobium puerariae]|uniref:Uncharacterized protein n=1 Tax=Rhizobium puerariae TaxID=1585791 RepID=A0ABV6ATI5_9HYPH